MNLICHYYLVWIEADQALGNVHIHDLNNETGQYIFNKKCFQGLHAILNVQFNIYNFSFPFHFLPTIHSCLSNGNQVSVNIYDLFHACATAAAFSN